MRSEFEEELEYELGEFATSYESDWAREYEAARRPLALTPFRAEEETNRRYGPGSQPRQVARSYLGGIINTLPFTLYPSQGKALPVEVSVFCPRAASRKRKVEGVVYAHGMLDVCPPEPKKKPEDLITAEPFTLGKIVDSS